MSRRMSFALAILSVATLLFATPVLAQKGKKTKAPVDDKKCVSDLLEKIPLMNRYEAFAPKTEYDSEGKVKEIKNVLVGLNNKNIYMHVYFGSPIEDPQYYVRCKASAAAFAEEASRTIAALQGLATKIEYRNNQFFRENFDNKVQGTVLKPCLVSSDKKNGFGIGWDEKHEYLHRCVPVADKKTGKVYSLKDKIPTIQWKTEGMTDEAVKELKPTLWVDLQDHWMKDPVLMELWQNLDQASGQGEKK